MAFPSNPHTAAEAEGATISRPRIVHPETAREIDLRVAFPAFSNPQSLMRQRSSFPEEGVDSEGAVSNAFRLLDVYLSHIDTQQPLFTKK